MKFVHTNIVARDWEKLAQFYINVFDCRLKPPQRKLSGRWLSQGTGLKNAGLEGVHLILPGYGDTGPTLEIFSYESMEESEPAAANKIGFSHIAFLVEDVEEMCTRALANGAGALGQTTTKEVDGVGTLTFVYLKDPERNIIEIQSWD